MPPPPPRRVLVGQARTLRMEWTKLRTVPGTVWSLLALAGFTLAVGVLALWTLSAGDCAPSCDVDTAKLSLTGVYLGQVAVVTLAVTAVTSEYETLMVRTTLAASPRRGRLLAAKAAVVAAVVLVAGLVTVLAALLAGRLLLPHAGYDAGVLSLADGATRRAFLGTVLYFGLVALLSVGVGAAVRHTGGAVVTVLGLLYVAPVLAQYVSDPQWREWVEQSAPMTAGLSIQATRHLDALFIAPWPGLGVLAAWSAGALAAGAAAMLLRDAG
jgi:ABC-2 type transport system permease protein